MGGENYTGVIQPGKTQGRPGVPGNVLADDYRREEREMFWIVYLAVIVAVFAGFWKAFEKAGAPGWAAIVPIFNIYVLTKMADKPGWWVVLAFIPLVNLVVIILICVAIAPKFGKSEGFGVGMALLSFIFWPIVGFGDARWNAAPVTI